MFFYIFLLSFSVETNVKNETNTEEEEELDATEMTSVEILTQINVIGKYKQQIFKYKY